MDLVGQRVGNYQLVRLLGEGGMGVVYEAVHPVLGRRAAIKILKLGVGTPAAAREVERFFTEARLVASLGHENIVEAFDFGEVRLGAVASYYVAMELLEGESLRARLTRGALPLGAVLGVGQQAAAALGAAHGRGVVHRDVKPDNLFLARKPDGREVLKVLDFGIAKLVGDATPPPTRGPGGSTASGVLLGTPAFMSPEQCAGRPLDARADVYALGLVLYEAATGRRAFVRETEPEVMAAQVRDPPPPPSRLRPDLPLAFEAVLLRALAKKPELRFANMASFGAALAQLEAGAAAVPSRAELDGLLEACTATRVIDAHGAVAAPVAGRAAVTLPLYAPAAAAAETHTVGRIDGPAPAAAASGPVGAAPGRRASGLVIVLSALGFLLVAALLAFGLPRLRPRGATPPAVVVAVAPTTTQPPPPASSPSPQQSPSPQPPQPQSPPALSPPPPPAPPPPPPSTAAHPTAPSRHPAAPAAEPRGHARLAVQVVPWAKVYLDGTLLGETPIDREVATGAHTLLLVNDGLSKEERIPLRLQPGERRTIDRRWKARE